VALNHFRIITRQKFEPHLIQYHAYLFQVDLSADGEDREPARLLLNTEAAVEPLKTPAAALAALMLITASQIDLIFSQTVDDRGIA